MRELDKEKVYRSLVSIAGRENTAAGDSIETSAWFDPLSERQKPPDFLVRPGSTKEVQKIVRMANRYGIPLVPRSSGFMFSPAGVPDRGAVLVDLSRMDRILHIDKRNRAAMIEPGVRWGNLQAELKKQGLRAVIPLLPHKDKSALTGFLDREPGLIPRFEYAEPILTMEVVLGSGEVFRTGSASGPAGPEKTKASLVGPYGPSAMDFFRLFQGSQGSLGIVTWMNVKVETLPKKQKLFIIPCMSLDEVARLSYVIQRRMIGYECLALNSQHLAGIISGDRGDDLEERKNNLPPWAVILCIGGGLRHPEKKLAFEEEALHEVTGKLGFKPVEKLDGIDSSFIEILQGPWKGETYFKHKLREASLDIFFITTLSRAPGCAAGFLDLAAGNKMSPEEIGIYIQPLEYGRACHVEFSAPFAPESSEDVKKARSLAEGAVELIAGQGGFFSRPHGLWGRSSIKRSGTHIEAARKLKKILDPQNALNPGVL